MPNNIDQLTQKIQQRLKQALKDIPTIVGNEAVNFVLDNFKEQGFQGDSGLMPWQHRKKVDKKQPDRKILIKTRRLERSIRITRKSATVVAIGTNVPYARIHNFGGEIHQAARSETFTRNRYQRGAKGKMFGGMGAYKKGTKPQTPGLTFKARVTNMPKRQFIGPSKLMNQRIRATAIATVKQRLLGN